MASDKTVIQGPVLSKGDGVVDDFRWRSIKDLLDLTSQFCLWLFLL